MAAEAARAAARVHHWLSLGEPHKNHGAERQGGLHMGEAVRLAIRLPWLLTAARPLSSVLASLSSGC